MDINSLQRSFGRMGARVAVRPVTPNRFGRMAGINIRNDAKGEYFDISVEFNSSISYEVVDVDEHMRHLLLMARDGNRKDKFLCGHDERHWFVCAVPGNSIARVRDAMEALQPEEVRLSVGNRVKRTKDRLRRRNAAFVRQGEWFFLPAPSLRVDPKRVLNHEPISRGRGSKPHICQFAYREGGVAVMVCNRFPTGVTVEEYSRMIAANPNARNWNWRAMSRNASVFARGAVRHPDHKTVELDGWHRVLMNTEAEARGAHNVVFLD